MRVALSEAAMDPGALLTAFSAGRARTGAVVSFTGLCRADPGELGLELEAYPGFTEAAIEAVLHQATARFALHDAVVVHRIGRVASGEPIVFAAAAAAHRRAAFEAADMIMDWLKSRAPFWKKALTPDGGRWIEPRAEDYADAARWDEHAPPQSALPTAPPVGEHLGAINPPPLGEVAAKRPEGAREGRLELEVGR